MGLENKKKLVKQRLKEKHKCGPVCQKCAKIFRLIDIMCESNIPAGYWFLSMKNFKGARPLIDAYDEYHNNILDMYLSGQSVCFAGNQGTGKTMASICILKSAIKAGYSVYYTTATDVLNNMTDYKTSSGLRYKLKTVDFLVVDELDSRFFVSDSVKELFSGIYENIFRSRTHNNMPTIICTNETDGLLNVFGGMSASSIASLNSQYLVMCPVAGKDFRKDMSK